MGHREFCPCLECVLARPKRLPKPQPADELPRPVGRRPKALELHTTTLRHGSQPTECPQLTDDEVDTRRRTRCLRYENCLNWACERGWDSWHCSDCQVDEPMPAEQMREEGAMLLRSFSSWSWR